MYKMTYRTVIIVCLVSFVSLCALDKANSIDEIVYTTFYPSPYGSYQDIEAGALAVGFANNAAPASKFWPGFATVKMGFDGVNAGVIGIGGDSSGDDVEIRLNSSINDLYVINAFTGGYADIQAANLPMCYAIFYSNSSDTQSCAPGYSVALAPIPNPPLPDQILCCRCKCDASWPGCGC